MANEDKPVEPEIRLVTTEARTLNTKSSLERPNPYTTDWTDMSDLTRREVQLRQSSLVKI